MAENDSSYSTHDMNWLNATDSAVIVNNTGSCAMCGCIGVARDRLLVHALADILCQAADSTIVICDIIHETLSSSLPGDASSSSAVNDEQSLNVHPHTGLQNELPSVSSTEVGSSQSAVKRRRLGHEQFHNGLR